MTTRLTFIQALSPLHAGTGRGIGVIDMPIAREKATQIPYLPGSSLKGALRDLCEDPDDLNTRVFGPNTDNAELYSGSAVFSDQRLLLLPVRSLRGVFAWATSPYILQRFKRDVLGAKIAVTELPDITVAESCECLVASQGTLLMNEDRDVYLEDFDLKGRPQESVDKWAKFIGENLFDDTQWREAFKARFCV
ncbi:MAG: type III-B CRISPR module RAMP protein Cmr4, partial [Blastocatellia bacterium]|nr:type III-B CRISPR module RAMP protein Cmr4 [Blastocatellia bacterium]